MKSLVSLLVTVIAITVLAACGGGSGDSGGGGETRAADGDTHTHADGTTHDDHDHPAEDAHGDDHDEVPLEAATIGGMKVELAQGHGAVKAGSEGHLVVKLPYKDGGATIVRAWIGTADRTMSYIGMGEYASSHDDYDIHAMAPDPLPANPMWWIEIEKPDGTKVVGSAKPMM